MASVRAIPYASEDYQTILEARDER